MSITREIVAFETEAEWLALREKDVTSTEVAALFGASPYLTEYELHQIKTGRLTKEFEANERMRWGNRLESAIAHGVAEDLGLIVEPFKVYMRIPELRMGSSFDFKIVGLVDGFDGENAARAMFREHGPGLLEVKNVDALAFRRNWIEGEDDIEAPPQYEFQVQHQMEVSNLGWAVLAPLIGGNTPKPIIRVRDAEIGELIRKKVGLFWQRIEAGVEPVPDFARDADTIGKLYVENDGSEIDLSDNPRVAELCREYKAAAADEKAAAERKKAAKAELLTIIEAAKTVRADGWKISAGTRKETIRVYDRAAGERMTITISKIPAATVEAAVPAYRDVRISEAA